MSQTGDAGAGPITFEQLISLNDEMAALVRAGVPLEGGLAELGRDLPGKSGKLAEMLAHRMTAGESLQQILASEPTTFPPVWRAMVEAGLRSGQLAAALESMSATARRLSELRKTVGAALIYPLVVLALAYVMFLFVVTHFAPVTLRAYRDLTGGSEWLLVGLSWLGETAPWWAPWLPLAAVVFVVAWWRRSGRAAWSDQRQRRPWPRRCFSLGFALAAVLRDERVAAFAEILSLLVRQQVPLAQAVVLAAEASGDGSVLRASQSVAERLQRGQTLARREDMPREFPPVLGWLIASRAQPSELGEALSRTAAAYRDRAGRAALWTAMYLPIALTVVVAGTATLVQGLITFAPVWELWYALARPL